MNRDHAPCQACAKFVPANAGSGHCTGLDRPAREDDQPCVLFVAQGSREARAAAKTEQERLTEMQRRRPETISRASAHNHKEN